jgi:hypothetical protein
VVDVTYHVVEFEGYRILDHGRSAPKRAIDFHVVDERGRTRAVVPYLEGSHGSRRNTAWRKSKAQRIADDLNGKLFTVVVKSYRWRYFCRKCRGTWYR